MKKSGGPDGEGDAITWIFQLSSEIEAECIPWRRRDAVNIEKARQWGLSGTHNVDRPSVPVFRAEGGKALCDLCPVLAPNLVPTCRSIAMASAARPRLVDDNHLDIKDIRRVCAQGLDDGSFCQGNRIRREKDGGGVQQRPKWND